MISSNTFWFERFIAQAFALIPQAKSAFNSYLYHP